jgi:hypothetical protein
LIGHDVVDVVGRRSACVDDGLIDRRGADERVDAEVEVCRGAGDGGLKRRDFGGISSTATIGAFLQPCVAVIVVVVGQGCI